MMATIEQDLTSVGACFAVRADRYVAVGEGHDVRPTYHIHPSAIDPDERMIMRFSSLKAIRAWVALTREAIAGRIDGETYHLRCLELTAE
jgi:hypothetical protein